MKNMKYVWSDKSVSKLTKPKEYFILNKPKEYFSQWRGLSIWKAFFTSGLTYWYMHVIHSSDVIYVLHVV